MLPTESSHFHVLNQCHKCLWQFSIKFTLSIYVFDQIIILCFFATLPINSNYELTTCILPFLNNSFLCCEWINLIVRVIFQVWPHHKMTNQSETPTLHIANHSETIAQKPHQNPDPQRLPMTKSTKSKHHHNAPNQMVFSPIPSNVINTMLAGTEIVVVSVCVCSIFSILVSFFYLFVVECGVAILLLQPVAMTLL